MKKTIIVTGGSRGIGRFIALELAKLNYNIAIFYENNTEMAEKTAEDIRKINSESKVFLFKVSVSDVEGVKRCFKELDEQGEQICGLVNNAGIIRDSFLMTMKENDWNDVINTNIFGTFNCSKEVIPYMIKNEGGIIVNIASVSGIKGEAGQTNYSATKSAIISLTRSMAVELCEKSINVYAIAPGFIETEMIHKMSARVLNKKIDMIPLKQLGKTDDVVKIVKFLFQENPHYMVGQVFVPDGGLSCI